MGGTGGGAGSAGGKGRCLEHTHKCARTHTHTHTPRHARPPTRVVNLGDGEVEMLVEGLHHPLPLLQPQQPIVNKHAVQAVAKHLGGSGGCTCGWVGWSEGGCDWPATDARTGLHPPTHPPSHQPSQPSIHSYARPPPRPTCHPRTRTRPPCQPSHPPTPPPSHADTHTPTHPPVRPPARPTHTLCTRVAATVESTPPESAQMTWSVGPTCRARGGGRASAPRSVGRAGGWAGGSEVPPRTLCWRTHAHTHARTHTHTHLRTHAPTHQPAA